MTPGGNFLELCFQFHGSDVMCCLSCAIFEHSYLGVTSLADIGGLREKILKLQRTNFSCSLLDQSFDILA